MADLPSRARVVIVGGGIVGCSVAYHLTRLGRDDVLLLEQGRLSSGTTWHAAGLVGPLRASESGTALVRYSAELYASLEEETGLATGYRNVGGLVVARTPDRLVQLARTAANGAAYGLEAELITPRQAQELWPPMQVDDLLGALWLPGDGKVNPADVTQSLAKGARQRGARIVEKVRVLGLATTGERSTRRVTGVRTDRGDVEAEVVVLCAGQWTKALGDGIEGGGITVPLHSAEHFYVVTEAVGGTHPDLPIMRDQDGWTYFKEEVGGLVVGGFEPAAKPWVAPDQIPYPFEFQLLDEDWEHFSVLMEQALLRIPALEHTGIRKFYNGPESFTPDNQFLLGETPQVAGLFVGCGFNSVGIASAGGAGKALAEWIVAGSPQEDLVAVDVRRFGPWQNDVPFLRERVVETLGLHYEIPWPNREFESARPQRTSPLHGRLVGQGALFGARNGWERPLVFGPTSLDYSWDRPSWLDACIAEQREVRTNVAVFDETSFSKYLVTGPAALAGLEWICGNDVDVAVGETVYTPWLGERGGYEADVTVTRLGADRFFVVSSAATTYRDLDHLHRHLPAGVEVRDVSDDYAVLGVFGPRTEAVVPRDTGGLPEGTIPIRSSYVDLTGVELFVPRDEAAALYDRLAIDPAGYYTIDALRIELGRRAFGRELGPDVTPREAGLSFALSKGKDFLGRAAAQREPVRRYLSLVVGDPDVMLWGGELLLSDGRPGGQVTSAAWGATVGAAVGLGYLRSWPVTAETLAGSVWTVDVGGTPVPVRLSLRAPVG
ncbi:4-methylaminobutanoate oxidase (formaldehyde-forming) [Nocardioides terrae]|uniref:4-methylaminobutanoate oxidase (Formaldehyde-forming) n=1 Tax=Nocardioides terrae TaxID=574651 RepID=A0A1I1JXF1_9ACTN|nr:FAD-dependent oxidoreductase [Nocardioides terrae]SFC50030.1 4-methylaminobutanoate oxidase (formaldehyde-forming) [Nocardioides terrae]